MTGHGVSEHTLQGGAGEGFGAVADAFAANFDERGEVGAALAVYQHGEPVVDLWAGLADPRTGRAWTATTPAVVFSCTKGVLAICAYLLVEEGRLDLDAPVVRYWPEFGQAGKSEDPRPLAAVSPRRALVAGRAHWRERRCSPGIRSSLPSSDRRRSGHPGPRMPTTR